MTNLSHTIILVEKTSIKDIIINDIDIKDVGAKTIGLCIIPQKWTLPFFVISTKLFEECKSNPLFIEDIIQSYIDNINTALTRLSISGSVILRSSAINEGMQERGKFESIEATMSTLSKKLKELIENLITIENDGMAIVVQQLSHSTITGHMSNERRFSNDKRDWKVEYYLSKNEFEQDTIAIREWREKMDLKIISESELLQTKPISQELKKVAYFWYHLSKKNSCRYHLEFVCDGHNIFIVQSDKDCINENAINPKTISTKGNSLNIAPQLQTLKKYSFEETSYPKLNNVREYNKLNLPTVPLYYLDDIETLNNLKNQKITKELKDDLEQLLKIQSIIIRCDTLSTSTKDRQMLPRSTELQNYEKVELWLKDNLNSIKDDFILIIHNYIPSIASAFAYAEPTNRIVKIQSLWGVPEGLYYNYHDTMIVDLSNNALEKITEDDVTVIIRKRFKDKFVYPMIDGRWSIETIKPPFDWNCSIDDKTSIFQIAKSSQLIADSTGKNVSVMWFVDIDESYYKTKNLPWYHEEVDLFSYTIDNYKRKYFSDEEVVITSKEELSKLSNNSEPNTIKCIRIKPTNETDLRNKKFIKEVGELAKEKNITILLEGTQLTHSYYQLKETGANVVCSEGKELLYTDTLDFNKLVRDRIPEKITSNGEKVKYGYVTDVLYHSLLCEKLLEEAYEVYDSSDLNELISELADVQEICDTILSIAKSETIKPIKLSDNNREALAKDAVSLCDFKIDDDGFSKLYKINNNFMSVNINREKTNFKFEINLYNYAPEIPIATPKKDSFTEEIRNFKKTMLKKASQLLRYTDHTKILNCVREIVSVVYKICELLNISTETIKNVQDKKGEKNGKFKKGYVLLQTSLKDSVVNPQNDVEHSGVFDMGIHSEIDICNHISIIDKKINKYSDFLCDSQNNKERLLIRFHVPVTTNDWKFGFESKKSSNFISGCDKIVFHISKKASGNLFLAIKAEKKETHQQLSLF